MSVVHTSAQERSADASSGCAGFFCLWAQHETRAGSCRAWIATIRELQSLVLSTVFGDRCYDAGVRRSFVTARQLVTQPEAQQRPYFIAGILT